MDRTIGHRPCSGRAPESFVPLSAVLPPLTLKAHSKPSLTTNSSPAACTLFKQVFWSMRDQITNLHPWKHASGARQGIGGEARRDGRQLSAPCVDSWREVSVRLR